MGEMEMWSIGADGNTFGLPTQKKLICLRGTKNSDAFTRRLEDLFAKIATAKDDPRVPNEIVIDATIFVTGIIASAIPVASI
jgi:hypothetical protein